MTTQPDKQPQAEPPPKQPQPDKPDSQAAAAKPAKPKSRLTRFANAVPRVSKWVYLLCALGVFGAIYGGFVFDGGRGNNVDAWFMIIAFTLTALFSTLLEWASQKGNILSALKIHYPHPLRAQLPVATRIAYACCYFGIIGAVYGGFVAAEGDGSNADALFWVTFFIGFAILYTALDAIEGVRYLQAFAEGRVIRVAETNIRLKDLKSLKASLPKVSRWIYIVCYIGLTGAIYGAFIAAEGEGENRDGWFWIGTFAFTAVATAILDVISSVSDLGEEEEQVLETSAELPEQKDSPPEDTSNNPPASK